MTDEYEREDSKDNKKHKSKGSDDDFCCGCCLGLAVGYMLFHGSNAHGATLQQRTLVNNEGIVVEQQANFLLRQIDNYQRNISPRIKESLEKDRLCRFEPSCSEYAKQAIETHGSVRGSLMAAERLLRCNPLSDGGYDPVI